MEFDSIKDARDFLYRYKDVKNFPIYGYEKFIYTYINDNFPKEIIYDFSKIVVDIIDIETDSTGGFAEVNLANKPIQVIGMRRNEQRLVLGYKSYTPTEKNVVYLQCVDEADMLEKFINIWADDDARPDIVTGWNIEKYDIPYLVNRIKIVLGEEDAKRLSPWGILREKTIESRGKQYQVYIPLGINVVDYLDLYRKFTYSQLESYTLDHVAFVEVKKRKVDYKEYGTLQKLHDQNYPLFIEYNIGDLDRIYEIEEKNKFLELAVTIAYDAKVNYIDSLTSVLLWETIIHNHLLSKNIVIPKDMKSEFMDIPGAFVKEPRIGLSEWVVSFDLQSLYPHLIMGTNISPETFVGIEPWNNSHIETVINREFKEDSEFARAGNGAHFRRDKQGFMAELMEIQFKKRLEYKNKMLELKKAGASKHEISKYHNWQLAKKIQLNSAYGAIANEWFKFYDWRLSSAITLSGQLSIRWIEKRLNEFLNDTLKTKSVDYIIAIDTDSVYIDCSEFVKRYMSNSSIEKNIDFLDKVSKEYIQPFIDKSFTELSQIMNAYKNMMIMKRDVICDKAIWRAKKAYVMNVWDAEGVRYKEPDLKVMGIEVVKSVIPQVCRNAIKDCLKLIMKGTEEEVRDFIKKFQEQFNTLPIEDISFPRGVNGLTKYYDAKSIWKLGSPIHVKGALVYNYLLKKHKLEESYSQIFEKDKLKFCYLREPNPAFCSVISYPQKLPIEFELDKYIDRKLMFGKTFLDPILSILNLIGWTHEKANTLETFFSGGN